MQGSPPAVSGCRHGDGAGCRAYATATAARITARAGNRRFGAVKRPLRPCERATEYGGKCGARLTAPKGRAQTEKQHHGGGANAADRGAFGDAAGRPADLFAADQRCGQWVRNRVLRLAHIRPRLPRGVVRDGQGEGRRGPALLP